MLTEAFCAEGLSPRLPRPPNEPRPEVGVGDKGRDVDDGTVVDEGAVSELLAVIGVNKEAAVAVAATLWVRNYQLSEVHAYSHYT